MIISAVRKKWMCLLSITLILPLAACSCRNSHPPENGLGQKTAGGETDEALPDPAALSWDTIWLVCWDGQQQEELLSIGDNSENICLFSCIFDEVGSPVIPDGMDSIADLVASFSFSTVYLSFANDLLHTDGSVTQKAPSLLSLLWSDETRMRTTSEDILDTVCASGANALEIDFENIGKAGLWQDFAAFLEVLLPLAQEEGFPVRVVLGSGTPLQEVSLPDGASYSVMCYNLYGTHSGPGPKADLAFLRKTAERFSSVTDIRYALASGGFEWDAQDKVTRSLTQAQAEEIAALHKSLPERDEGSMALHFTYGNGSDSCTIWYADAVTLAAWQKEISLIDSDARFDLWRVGGNRFE